MPEGKDLAREGEFGGEFFMFDSGAAEVTKAGERIAELWPGDYFGEMALLEEDRRVATVTATSPMSLIVMTRASFRSLDRSKPQLHETVCKAIAAPSGGRIARDRVNVRILRRTPSTLFSRRVSRWRLPSRIGTISRPRAASCCISGGGTSGQAAVTQIRSYGACSGTRVPRRRE